MPHPLPSPPLRYRNFTTLPYPQTSSKLRSMNKEERSPDAELALKKLTTCPRFSCYELQ